MKIAFTLCSNNYLAQAKTLGDSIKQLNPEYLFFIGLVDTLSNDIDYRAEIGYDLILSNEIGIPDFDNLWKKYSIIEFNTCVKPFYFQYFIKKFKPLDYLFYIDPDILILNDLTIVEHEFESSSKLLLTPHILSPIPLDSKTPGENIFLNYGIFNLGFLGLKNPGISDHFLEWWKERTYHLGFDQTSAGLFVDQLWFNLVPIFFKNVKISRHPGLNMAPWNLHERIFNSDRSVLFLGQSYPLVFYHFSKYNLSEPDLICSHYDRYNFDAIPEIRDFYIYYSELLLRNRIKKFSTISCHYMELQKKHLEDETKVKIKVTKIPFLKRVLKLIIPPGFFWILKRIKGLFAIKI